MTSNALKWCAVRPRSPMAPLHLSASFTSCTRIPLNGATSFVGVIHILHKDTAAKEKSLTVRGGSYGTVGFQFSSPVPLSGKWSSRLSLDAQREGFSDDRTNYRRGHALWRIERKRNGANRGWCN